MGLQIQVKAKYGLWVTQAEKDAILRVLDKCATTATDSAAPTPAPTNDAPTPPEDSNTQFHGLVRESEPSPTVEEPALAQVPEPTPEPAAAPEPVYEEPVVEQPSFEYANCCAVWQALGRSIWAGEPGFHSGLDGDGDGKGCDRHPLKCH
ncbi:excalibur calcium-binding domain-containing protein [Schaalia sp. Marseille-Q2122]|uniref:excalibur calcium-binding domain-containing protein n=1 Tax=Schaalia sp. Marseille-Q2122 TaxID=2736604 RepID=UPI00158C8AAF|nr:excalibur calcium-binding domain-containing protein [Schaalia sp. Marseille-Q2122]